jgi:hypothetical protein
MFHPAIVPEFVAVNDVAVTVPDIVADVAVNAPPEVTWNVPLFIFNVPPVMETSAQLMFPLLFNVVEPAVNVVDPMVHPPILPPLLAFKVETVRVPLLFSVVEPPVKLLAPMVHPPILPPLLAFNVETVSVPLLFRVVEPPVNVLAPIVHPPILPAPAVTVPLTVADDKFAEVAVNIPDGLTLKFVEPVIEPLLFNVNAPPVMVLLPIVHPPIVPLVEVIFPEISAALAVTRPFESTLNAPLPIFNVPPVIVPPLMVGEFIVSAAFIVPALILFASKLRIYA